jgi:hypothetical protein
MKKNENGISLNDLVRKQESERDKLLERLKLKEFSRRTHSGTD